MHLQILEEHEDGTRENPGAIVACQVSSPYFAQPCSSRLVKQPISIQYIFISLGTRSKFLDFLRIYHVLILNIKYSMMVRLADLVVSRSSMPNYSGVHLVRCSITYLQGFQMTLFSYQDVHHAWYSVAMETRDEFQHSSL
jgi:hypothetical protein